MGCDYIPYDPSTNKAIYDELDAYLLQVFPDSAVRKWCLELYATCLDPRITPQQLFIHVSPIENGKSSILNLLRKTFGDFMVDSSSQLLTDRYDSVFTDELNTLTDKRIAVITDYKESDVIDTSAFKRLLGGDKFRLDDGTMMFRDQSAKLFMSCTKPPLFSSLDMGTLRRVCIIPHNIPDVDESRLNVWAPYFAGMLVNHYSNYEKPMFTYCEPAIIEEARRLLATP
jgi:phage/plasmid-associated DNA primase